MEVDEDAGPCTALGVTLVERRRELDRGEAEWLEWLVDFDRQALWRADGQVTAASWLVQHCGMARTTAKEKLRIAHELAGRARLAAAYAGGALSYSKLRAITRITGVDDDTDQALLHVARTGTARDLDLLARHWEQLKEQERLNDPASRWQERSLKRLGTFNGIATVELRLPDDDEARLLSILDTYIEHTRRHPVDEAPAETAADAEPVDETSAEVMCDLTNPR